MHRDLEAAELAARIATADEPFVVDVRETLEFQASSIPSAVNIPSVSWLHLTATVPHDRQAGTEPLLGPGVRRN